MRSTIIIAIMAGLAFSGCFVRAQSDTSIVDEQLAAWRKKQDEAILPRPAHVANLLLRKERGDWLLQSVMLPWEIARLPPLLWYPASLHQYSEAVSQPEAVDTATMFGDATEKLQVAPADPVVAVRVGLETAISGAPPRVLEFEVHGERDIRLLWSEPFFGYRETGLAFVGERERVRITDEGLEFSRLFPDRREGLQPWLLSPLVFNNPWFAYHPVETLQIRREQGLLSSITRTAGDDERSSLRSASGQELRYASIDRRLEGQLTVNVIQRPHAVNHTAMALVEATRTTSAGQTIRETYVPSARLAYPESDRHHRIVLGRDEHEGAWRLRRAELRAGDRVLCWSEYSGVPDATMPRETVRRAVVEAEWRLGSLYGAMDTNRPDFVPQFYSKEECSVSDGLLVRLRLRHNVLAAAWRGQMPDAVRWFALHRDRRIVDGLPSWIDVHNAIAVGQWLSEMSIDNAQSWVLACVLPIMQDLSSGDRARLAYDLIDAAQPGPLAMLWATEKDPEGKWSELSAERAALIEEWASQSRDGLCGTNYWSERVDAFTRVYRPILERHK